MAVDWNAVATITGPVVALVAGVYINRWFENRPKLIAYYGHIGEHVCRPADQPQFPVYTHNIVLRNAGRLPATNVRLMHAELPDVNVFPHISFTIERTPGGSVDLILPRLVPGEQVTVSYLYFPPTTVNEINRGIKSDQGFATAIPVLLQRQAPKWLQRLRLALMVVGVIALLYMLYFAVSWGLTKLP